MKNVPPVDIVWGLGVWRKCPPPVYIVWGVGVWKIYYIYYLGIYFILSRFSLYCRYVYCTVFSNRFTVGPELKMKDVPPPPLIQYKVLGVWRTYPPPLLYSIRCWGYDGCAPLSCYIVWGGTVGGMKNLPPSVGCWRMSRLKWHTVSHCDKTRDTPPGD